MCVPCAGIHVSLAMTRPLCAWSLHVSRDIQRGVRAAASVEQSRAGLNREDLDYRVNC